MGRVFCDQDTTAFAAFGRRPLRLRHLLADDPLFSDAALARLIEAAPRDHFHVNTMARDERDPRKWREGDMSGLSGEDVLAAVAKGNLWVHVQRVQELALGYGALLDAIFEEVAARVPGFNSFKRSMSLLVSSPRMNVAYHADVPGQSLWQVRGGKRAFVYPAHAPYLPQRAIEDIVVKRATDTDLHYDPSFDEAAAVFDLRPGDMATWPRNAPHRVVNEDCVNVSFTTEHWTSELRAGYIVDYANGLLRPLLGGRDLSRESRGPALFAKAALAAAHKAACGFVGRALPLTVDFRVDPTMAQGFADIAPYRIMK